VVQLRKRSRDTIAMLEAARVRFYVNCFRADFEMIEEFLATRPAQTRNQWYGRKAVQGALDGLRGVYEQTAGLSVAPDRWRVGPHGPVQTAGDRAYTEIRSRFFCAPNR